MKWNVLLRWVGLVIGFFIVRYYFFTTSHTHNYFNNYHKSQGFDTDKVLSIISDSINKLCPMNVDSITTAVNTYALPNKIFQYNYSVNIDTTKYNMGMAKGNLEKYLLNSLRTNPSYDKMKTFNATFIYSYSTNDGNFLFKFTYPPEKYR